MELVYVASTAAAVVIVFGLIPFCFVMGAVVLPAFLTNVVLDVYFAWRDRR